MSTTKKQPKSPEELQAVLQKLIAQGRKDGMIRDCDLRAALEDMDLTAEKIEEILSNDDLYARMSKSALEIFERELTIDKMVEGYMSVYRSLND